MNGALELPVNGAIGAGAVDPRSPEQPQMISSPPSLSDLDSPSVRLSMGDQETHLRKAQSSRLLKAEFDKFEVIDMQLKSSQKVIWPRDKPRSPQGSDD